MSKIFLNSLTSIKQSSSCFFKIIGTFSYADNIYFVFFVGHKKYVYIPSVLFKVFSFTNGIFTFKNVFVGKHLLYGLLNSLSPEKPNFTKFFISTAALQKKNTLKFFFLSCLLNLKIKLKYSFFVTKLKTTKFYFLSKNKLSFLNKSFDISIFNLYIRSFFLRFRLQYFYFFNFFLISFLRKFSVFLLPKIFTRNYLYFQIWKQLQLLD